MNKKSIEICKIGHFNHSLDFEKLKKWKSDYFNIIIIKSVDFIDVDHFSDDYIYPNDKIIQNIGAVESNIDIKIAIIDQPLDGDYYMHRLDGKKGVISIFPVLDVLKNNNIPLENYIMRCIYEFVVFYYEGSGNMNQNIYLIPHHETRCCLFDMNVYVERIIFSSIKPIICKQCESRLSSTNLPVNFVNNIQNELKRIKLPIYYRLENRFKRNPFFYLSLTALLAILLNILSDFVYDFFSK